MHVEQRRWRRRESLGAESLRETHKFIVRKKQSVRGLGLNMLNPNFLCIPIRAR